MSVKQNRTVNNTHDILNKEVGTVKNVTQYTVGSIVRKQPEYNELLSQLKTFSSEMFLEQLTTRERWAKELGISPKTINRWEIAIIKSKIKFAFLYYDGAKRKRKAKLDHYQRFFLSLIAGLTKGAITGSPMTYAECIAWLESTDEGRPRWMRLTRKEFEQAQNYYQQKVS
jgi:hypothetical protein